MLRFPRRLLTLGPAGSLPRGAARARWPSRSSKPVRCGNPTLGRFDSGAAPSSRLWRSRAAGGSLSACAEYHEFRVALIMPAPGPGRPLAVKRELTGRNRLDPHARRSGSHPKSGRSLHGEFAQPGVGVSSLGIARSRRSGGSVRSAAALRLVNRRRRRRRTRRPPTSSASDKRGGSPPSQSRAPQWR